MSSTIYGGNKEIAHTATPTCGLRSEDPTKKIYVTGTGRLINPLLQLFMVISS